RVDWQPSPPLRWLQGSTGAVPRKAKTALRRALHNNPVWGSGLENPALAIITSRLRTISCANERVRQRGELAWRARSLSVANSLLCPWLGKAPAEHPLRRAVVRVQGHRGSCVLGVGRFPRGRPGRGRRPLPTASRPRPRACAPAARRAAPAPAAPSGTAHP